MNTTSGIASTADGVEDGFHVISFAYPWSPLANVMNFGCVGCFVLQKAGSRDAHLTFAAALHDAAAGKTSPGRWSIDHPLNQHFLSPDQRRDVALVRDPAVIVRTRTGHCGSVVWKVGQDPTDRDWRLRGGIVGETRCKVRKDGAVGTLLEAVYMCRETDPDHRDVAGFEFYKDSVEAILEDVPELATAFPKVYFAVPPVSEVVGGRPALWAFVPDEASLSATGLTRLLNRMRDL